MYRRLFVDGVCERVDADVLSDLSGLECLDKSLAVQSSKDETDINTIVKRFGLTGQVPTGYRMPVYADFLDVPDTYQGALEVVRRADQAFMKVPPAIRARFDNDPGQFIAFVSDPANLEACVKMGLAPKKSQEVPKDGVPVDKP